MFLNVQMVCTIYINFIQNIKEYSDNLIYTHLKRFYFLICTISKDLKWFHRTFWI